MDASSAADRSNHLTLLAHFLRHYLTSPPSASSSVASLPPPSRVGVWARHAAFVVQDPAALHTLADPFTLGAASFATSELAQQTVARLIGHGVPAASVAITANYTEKARIRARLLLIASDCF